MLDQAPYCPWCFKGKVLMRYSPTGKRFAECVELCGFKANLTPDEYHEMFVEQQQPSKKEEKLSRENDSPKVD